MEIDRIVGQIPDDIKPLLERTKIVKRRSTLYDTYKLKPQEHPVNSKGDYIGYNSFLNSTQTRFVTWYNAQLLGCCGGILAHDFRIIPDPLSEGTKKNLDALLLIKFLTEFQHNVMNREQRPITIGTLTSSSIYHLWAFKYCGWGIGKGVPSMKHVGTWGLHTNKNILNVIYPIYLRVRGMRRKDPVISMEDELALANELTPQDDVQERTESFDERDYE